VNIFNKTYAVTAEITVPEIGAAGVILAHGGMFGGYSLYAKDGKLKYCYNFVGLQHFYVETDRLLPAGTHQARMEFAYDGGGLGKGGTVSLYLDGQKVGEGRVEKTNPFGFSFDETCDVGKDMASPVSPDYGARGNAFNGEVNWVEIDVDKEALDQDHFLTGEERFHIAMARQ
jgi:arylsulfatase